MSETALRLKEEILRLPEEDRWELAQLLWEALDPSPEDDADEGETAWIAELERRAADLDAGRSTAEPVDQVFAELRKEALGGRTVQ